MDKELLELGGGSLRNKKKWRQVEVLAEGTEGREFGKERQRGRARDLPR
jgi:hypothetical protein